jgi:sulfur relay (sulfurtransferase) DsrC/TusE family protein
MKSFGFRGCASAVLLGYAILTLGLVQADDVAERNARELAVLQKEIKFVDGKIALWRAAYEHLNDTSVHWEALQHCREFFSEFDETERDLSIFRPLIRMLLVEDNRRSEYQMELLQVNMRSVQQIIEDWESLKRDLNDLEMLIERSKAGYVLVSITHNAIVSNE